MRICRMYNEKGRGTRKRPTSQPRRSTKCQDKHFRQLAMRDHYATTRKIGD